MHQIFYMDDDSEELRFLKDALESSLPIKVIPVPDSEIAMQLIRLRSDFFSAYILDIEMDQQKYSGIQIAEEIRRQPNCALTPIIFLTTYKHFGIGGLRYIHYYDFFQKPYEIDQITESISNALSLQTYIKQTDFKEFIVFESCGITIKWDPSNISCIEISGPELCITDLLGKEFIYRVKPNVFSCICKSVSALKDPFLQRIHRCVVINVNRIKLIDWHKNYANVQLFNTQAWKPAGKTYLKALAIYGK